MTPRRVLPTSRCPSTTWKPVDCAIVDILEGSPKSSLRPSKTDQCSDTAVRHGRPAYITKSAGTLSDVTLCIASRYGRDLWWGFQGFWEQYSHSTCPKRQVHLSFLMAASNLGIHMSCKYPDFAFEYLPTNCQDNVRSGPSHENCERDTAGSWLPQPGNSSEGGKAINKITAAHRVASRYRSFCQAQGSPV